MFAIPYNPSDPLKDIVTEPLTRVVFFYNHLLYTELSLGDMWHRLATRDPWLWTYTKKKLIWNHPPPKKLWLSSRHLYEFCKKKDREIQLYGETRMRDIPKSKKHPPHPPPPPPQNRQTHESFSKEKATRNFVFQTVQRIKNIPHPKKK